MRPRFTYSLRNKEDTELQREFQDLKAEGYEPDTDGAVLGDQFEALLFCPDSETRARLLRAKSNPKETPRKQCEQAVIDAIFRNPRAEAQSVRSLWIDDVETHLRAALGYDKLAEKDARNLLSLIPSVGTSLDFHYGVDMFALAWKPESAAIAGQFRKMMVEAHKLQCHIDTHAGFKVNTEEQQQQVAMILGEAAKFLDQALRKGQCAMATVDATLNSEKIEETGSTHPDLSAATKADLLVHGRGGTLHPDYEQDLKRSNGMFDSREINAKKRMSRRVYMARALKLILERKWEAHPGLRDNIRFPGAPAEWTKTLQSTYGRKLAKVLKQG